MHWLYPPSLVCFVSNSFKSLDVYQSWSHVAAQQDQISCNLYLVITLVDPRRKWKLSKSLLLSSLWRLGYVLLCWVLIFWSPPCWVLTLWLPLFAIPPLHSACFYDPICATWKFTLGVWSVMVLWVATTVPRWNLGPPCGRPAHGCAAGCALVSRILIMIHYGTRPMCHLIMSFSSIISPDPIRRSPCLIRRSLYRTKSSKASFWSCKKDNLEE